MIENGRPNGMNNASKLRPLASKVSFILILMDFAMLGLLMGAGKRLANKSNKSDFGRAEIKTGGEGGIFHYPG